MANRKHQSTTASMLDHRTRACPTSSHNREPENEESDLPIEDYAEKEAELATRRAGSPPPVEHECNDHSADGDSSSDYVNNTSEEEDYDEGLPEEEEGITYYIRYCPEDDSYLEGMDCNGEEYASHEEHHVETDECQEAIEEWAEGKIQHQDENEVTDRQEWQEGQDNGVQILEEETSSLEIQDQEENIQYCQSEGGYQDYYPAEANGNSRGISPYHSRKEDAELEEQEEDIDQIVAEIKMSMSMSSINSTTEMSPEHIGTENMAHDYKETCSKGEAVHSANRHEGRPKSLNIPSASKHSGDTPRGFKAKSRTPEDRQKWPQEQVCLAIAHYSQPTDLQLLFAFEYVGEIYHNPAKKVNGIDPGGGGASGQQTPLFETYSDWDREIKRTGASEWRVCSVNEGYMISTCLPEYFVVPSSLADQDLKLYSYSFIGRRMPLWSWNHPNGSALVRMANIKDVLQQRRIDQRICNAITRSHPLRSDVYKSDLDKSLPSIQEIQAAHVKLKQLCVNEPFEETEEKWLSSLENTHWLEYIRSFLKHSAELVYMMECKHVSVVLQEEEGRDLSCLAASLIQVMLDPYFRTIVGFQSLIQKEWVMAGYQFLDRCNHLKRSDKESPLFLMFLDCVWQLLEQYPAAFEFSEIYLTVLYDSARVSLFGTFLFNCPHQRVKESTEFAISKNIQLGDEKGLRFPCVWDWSLQFTNRDRLLFHNPLYIGKSAPCVQNGAVKTFKRSKKNYSSTLRGVPPALKNGIIGEQEFLPRRNSLILKLKPDFLQHTESPTGSMEQYFRDWFAKPVDLHGVILPCVSGTQIKLWKLCYFRWVPEAQINRGGSITAFHKVSLLADEVDMLNRSLRQYKSNSSLHGSCLELDQSRMYFRANSLNDTSGAPDFLSSSFPFSPVGNLCRRSILGTPLSKFLSGAKIWLSTETLANED